MSLTKAETKAITQAAVDFVITAKSYGYDLAKIPDWYHKERFADFPDSNLLGAVQFAWSADKAVPVYFQSILLIEKVRKHVNPDMLTVSHMKEIRDDFEKQLQEQIDKELESKSDEPDAF